jgi:NADPH-dependent 7-cyano-7-deazaguanine reductase QueF-like protein
MSLKINEMNALNDQEIIQSKDTKSYLAVYSQTTQTSNSNVVRNFTVDLFNKFILN